MPDPVHVLSLLRGDPVPDAGSPAADLTQVIAARIAEKPDGILRTYFAADRQTETSYRDAWERSASIAARLAEACGGPGRPVLILAGDLTDVVPAFWGCLRSGAVAVPLMSLARAALQGDPAPLFALVDELIEPVVLVDRRFAAVAADIARRRRVPVVDLADIGDAAQSWHDRTPHDPVCLISTSGSTGLPKLAALGHATLLSRYLGAQTYPSARNRHTLGTFPFDSITGLQCIFARFLSWTYIEPVKLATQPVTLLDVIARYRIDIVVTSNSLLARLPGAADARQSYDLSSIRSVNLGGEPLSRAVVDRLNGHLRSGGAPIDVLRLGYGATEIGPVVTGAAVAAQPRDGDVSVGRPVAGVSIRIVQKEHDGDPSALAGEIEVDCGVRLFSGYGLPAQLSPAALSEGRWWRTGDIGYVRDGQLYVTGRAKDVLIYHGRKFSLAAIDAEIGSVLHASEKGHAVALRTQPDGAEQLAIAIVADDATAARRADLRDIVSRAILRRFGIPCDVVVDIDEASVPRTATRKLRRQELAQIVSERLGRLGDDTKPRDPASTSIVRRIGAAWNDALSLTRPVGLDEDFFDLGGDSLRAVALHSRILAEFGVDIPSDAFFEQPSLRTLISLVQQHQRVPGNDSSAWPLPAALRGGLSVAMHYWSGTPVGPGGLVLGFNREGSKPPIVWVFNVAHEARNLAEALGEDQPLYALRSGYGLTDYSEDDIQRLALGYMSELAAIHDGGNLVIGGNCQGGIIALAMAQHAARRGWHVPLLILMDWAFPLHPTPVPVLFVSGRRNTRQNPAQRFLGDVAAWERFFPHCQTAEIDGGYAEGFSAGHVQQLAGLLDAHIRKVADRPLRYLPRAARHATLTIVHAPAIVRPGRGAKLVVEILNTSEFAFGAHLRLRVGAVWRRTGDVDDVGYAKSGTPVPQVPAHGRVRLDVAVEAPDVAGSYELMTVLIEAGNRWFGDHDSRSSVSILVDHPAPIHARLAGRITRALSRLRRLGGKAYRRLLGQRIP